MAVMLCGKSNLDFPALNHEEHFMNVPVQIVTALASSATADDTVKMIQQIEDAWRTALNRAENPDLTK
jgi:hypothetical protein